MRFPAPNQYPAQNSYPNAWWPPVVVVPEAGDFATLCDVFGVEVGALEAEVVCGPLATMATAGAAAAAVGLPTFADVALAPAYQATATASQNLVGVGLDELATGVTVPESVTALTAELATATVIPLFATASAVPAQDTDAVLAALETDTLEPDYELEVAC